ncbi:MAG: crossover junction endodeoxyribonuclease RuvC [bacterium]
MIILAIDPGVERLGVAILTKNDASIACVMSDTIVTAKELTQSERVGIIFTKLKEICQKQRPNQIVLERLFFAKNVKTAIIVAQVQGIIHLLGYQMSIGVAEIAPNAIKSAVTGYGNADKKAIKKMIDLQVILPKKKRLDDEYDAIACGYAFLLAYRSF